MIYRFLCGLASDEPTRHTDDEKADDDSDEIPVIEKRNNAVHDYVLKLDVVTAERNGKNEKDYPCHNYDGNRIHESDITGRSLTTRVIRPDRLTGSNDGSPLPFVFANHRHVGYPLVKSRLGVERARVLNLSKQRDDFQ